VALSLGAIQVAVICLMLMTLQPKSYRLLETYSTGVSWGRRWITTFIGFSEFGEKVK
jgi:hypothetical protein